MLTKSILLGSSLEINSLEINSHEINSHEINSPEINSKFLEINSCHHHILSNAFLSYTLLAANPKLSSIICCQILSYKANSQYRSESFMKMAEFVETHRGGKALGHAMSNQHKNVATVTDWTKLGTCIVPTEILS